MCVPLSAEPTYSHLPDLIHSTRINTTADIGRFQEYSIFFWGLGWDFSLQSSSCSPPRPSPTAPLGGFWIFMSFWVTPPSRWCRNTSRWVHAPGWGTPKAPIRGTQIPLGATQVTLGGPKSHRSIPILHESTQISPFGAPKYHSGNPTTQNSPLGQSDPSQGYPNPFAAPKSHLGHAVAHGGTQIPPSWGTLKPMEAHKPHIGAPKSHLGHPVVHRH